MAWARNFQNPSKCHPIHSIVPDKRTSRAAIFALALSITACQQHPSLRSYLALPTDRDGRAAEMPVVVRAHICGAEVLAVGVEHGRGPSDPLYASLEALFDDFSPTLVLHESSTPQRPASDRVAAIRANGEIGFMQFLSGERDVPFRSGDMPEALEFPTLLAEIQAQQLLIYLTSQRLLATLDDEAAARDAYPAFYQDYLVAAGFPDNDIWSTWEGFRITYRDVMGQDYDAKSFEPDYISPIRNLGPLNAIARRAHRIRDRYLLEQILRAEDRHDARIMVVFGAWHVLAIEPVLKAAKSCETDRLTS